MDIEHTAFSSSLKVSLANALNDEEFFSCAKKNEFCVSNRSNPLTDSNELRVVSPKEPVSPRVPYTYFPSYAH